MHLLNIPTYLIAWTEGFLSDRSFRVNVNGTLSGSKPITAGVPQGAVVSPLLFSIYINDIPKPNETNKSFSNLYADDLNTSFFFTPKTIKQTEKKLIIICSSYKNGSVSGNLK